VVQQVDGRSFLPLLKNPALRDNARALVWHHPNRWIAAEGPRLHWASGIRQGDWKLVYDHRTAALELYNLKDDLGEQQNLATQQPDKVKQLALLLTKQLKAWDAQMPTFKKTGKPVAWPDEVTGKNGL
jgi:arylsulfatase A-like enzyme